MTAASDGSGAAAGAAAGAARLPSHLRVGFLEVPRRLHRATVPARYGFLF
ncbi:MAG: hypothetical protein LBR07_03100 [Puniceicoccales bacterium]|nr:hypothetical protein [Puniceicoccales bacterium]